MRSVVSAAVLTISVAMLSSCQKQETAATKPKIVETVKVRSTAVANESTITGSIAARVQSDLSFRVSGRITDRQVDVGATVKKGQLLARIDAQEQKADLGVAAANLQAAEAQETQAQLAFDRQQRLFNSEVTTRADFDQAQEALLTTQGSTKSARAQLDTAQDALSFTELRADADGVITARSAEVGQVAQAAQVIFTLAHDGPRDAVFNVYESLFLGRKLEDKVKVSLFSSTVPPVEAPVSEISPTIDTSTGTIRVKVGLEDVPSMKLGAPVVGDFRSVAQETIALPWSAMSSKGGRPALWVVDPSSSTVSIRSVEVSKYGTASFDIRSGVSLGEVVVSQGTKFLRQGETVAVQEASE